MDVRAEVKQFILDVIVSESGQDIADFADAESLLDAGILDSLGILKLISFLDDELGIDIPVEEFELKDFASLDQICAWIDKHGES